MPHPLLEGHKINPVFDAHGRKGMSKIMETRVFDLCPPASRSETTLYRGPGLLCLRVKEDIIRRPWQRLKDAGELGDYRDLPSLAALGILSSDHDLRQSSSKSDVRPLKRKDFAQPHSSP